MHEIEGGEKKKRRRKLIPDFEVTVLGNTSSISSWRNQHCPKIP